MTNYIMIPANELEYRDALKWTDLNPNDVAELIEYRDVFIKLIKRTQNSIMMDLWMGKMRWNEEKCYVKIEWYTQLINIMEQLVSEYQKYQEMTEK